MRSEGNARRRAATAHGAARAAAVAAALGVAALLSLAGATAHAEPPAAKRPNVIVFLLDDAAFMDFGTFGGEALTPNIDRLAARGALLSSYHSSPLCSPSRAMLLTGVDNHRTGVATIEEVLPPEQRGRPGYSLHLEPGVLTIADRLKAAGYRTYMTGKWHLGHGPGDLPDGHGFDHSLALDASGADNWAAKPYMPYYQTAPWFEDGKPARMPDSFYSSQLLVDRMLDWLRADASRPEPFFAYVAFQAVHIPVQAPREFIDHYRGRFDGGFEQLRKDRWQRARERGLIPQDAKLAPAPAQLRTWQSLSDDERRIYAQSMAVYSGMMEAADFHIGRVLAWLEETGQLDDTIVVVTSDNGPEPSDPVHASGMGVWMPLHGYSWELANLGGPGSLAFIGPEWAAAASSPGQLFKFYSAEGGLRVPFVIAGPGVNAGTTVATPAFVTDVTPTILDLAGVDATGGGVPIMGRTLRPVLNGEAARAYPIDVPVGFEVSGNAALFRGDWKLVKNQPPWGDGAWHLFELARDPGETSDVTKARPDLAAALQRDYDAYARDVGVQPLPPGYDVQHQIVVNAMKKQLDAYGLRLAIAALVLLGGVVLVVRRVRRARRAH